MAVLDNPTWIFNLSDPQRDGLIERFDSEVKATPPSFILGDGADRNFILVTPRPNDSTRKWDYFNPSGHSLEFGILPLEVGPTSGTFTLTFGADTTSALAYNISAAALATALNALASITAAGGVTVSALGTNGYKITFTAVGARSTLAVNGTLLFPELLSVPIRTTVGGANENEVQVVRLAQYYAYSASNTALPVAAAVINSPAPLQVGTATLPSVQRIRLDPEPYDGSWIPLFSKAEITRVQAQPAVGSVAEVSTILANVADVAGSLHDKVAAIVYEGPNVFNAVQILLSNGGAITTAIPSGGRRITVTIVNGDSAATIAGKIQVAVDADASFAATVSTALVTVTRSFNGAVREIEAGSSGYGVARITEGSNTVLQQVYFTIYDANNAPVGVYISESAISPPPADHPVRLLGRYIQVTVVAGDSASTVGGLIATAVDADPDFTASNASGVVTITAAAVGNRTDSTPNTSTFGVSTTSQGLISGTAIPHNATAAEMKDALGEDFFTVVKSGDFQWDISFVELGAQSAFTANVAGLKVPVGTTGAFSTDTSALFAAFAALAAGVHELTAYLEGSLTLLGKKPLTFYRQLITIYRDAIP